MLTRTVLRNTDYAAGLPSYGTLQRDRIGAQDPLAFGDLNGDGVEDAVVVLLLVDGNTGHRYLAAVLNKNGAPQHVASAFLGLNIRIDAVAITDGIVTLQTKQLGPNDPTCCPTKEVAAVFELAQNTWQLLGEMPSGQITANFSAQLPAASPSLDPTLEHALHTLRTAWQSAGEGMYQLFLATGASAQFGPIASTSQWHSAPNRIIINERYRTESPEALAHALIWPAVALAFYMEAGAPDSWEACIERVVAQHTAQAQWWLSEWGESGNPIPTQLEQEANINLALYLDGQLGDRLRNDEHYRQYCAQFGEPPSAQLPKDTVLAVLPHKLAKEMGHKEGSGGYYMIANLLRKSVESAMWLYEGHYVLSNPRLGNADPRLAIGVYDEQEKLIRSWLNDPAEMRRTAQEVRTWLYTALSGRATGNIQDTGNAWLNRLLRSDPEGLVYWVTGMEEAFVRALYPGLAETIAPARRTALENQILIFLYTNAEDPDRTTGPTMLPRGWLE